MDEFDYIMHGRVFAIKHLEAQNVEVQSSFGGLLMRIRAEQLHVEQLAIDDTFYLLMRILPSGGQMDIWFEVYLEEQKYQYEVYSIIFILFLLKKV